MLRMLVNRIVSSANGLLTYNQTTTWGIFRNFIASTFTIFGRPLMRRLTNSDTLYECVNTLLSNPTTTTTTVTQHHTEQRQRQNSNLNRHSRPNFRRRTHRPVIRIIKPTVHIHMNSS